MTTGTRARILIVEDERLIALGLERQLEALGYEVVGSVATGEEALASIARARPDLVLLDIRLAGRLDGVNTASEIAAAVDVPFVFLTAHADAETIERAKRTRPVGFLVKPINEQELTAMIQIALHNHPFDTHARHMIRWLEGMPEPPVSEEGRRSWSDDSAYRSLFERHALSSREREVLQIFLRGFQTETIAQQLHISPQTVRNHLKRIARKFDVSSQGELRELFARVD